MYNILSSCLLLKNVKIIIRKTTILPEFLYGCETWCLTLTVEHRLRVVENTVLRRISRPKRDEETGVWRQFYNEVLHDLYSWPSTIRLRMRGHVARIGEKRNAYMLLPEKMEGRRPLGRPRYMWVDNIDMNLGEMGWVGIDWIGLAQNRD
jgi:hypothetical protein